MGFESALSKAGDARQDLVSRLDPDVGLARVIVNGDELL
jgi:hypothetical protein